MSAKLLITCLLVTAAVSFGFYEGVPVYGDDILSSISKKYHNDCQEVMHALQQYRSVVEESESTPIAIQEAHSNARLAFKKIEFLFEYSDPAGTKQRINGAPLPKTEPKVADITIIEPKGLQTLDELVVEDSLDLQHIRYLVGLLCDDFQSMHTYQQRIQLTHQMVFEAVRLELVRIFTLGVTGFDTPGTVQAIPEAIISLTSCQDALLPYLTKPMAQEIPTSLVDSMMYSFNRGEELLRASSFEGFDRLSFLVECINPLYRDVLRLQKIYKIEFPSDVQDLISAHNYQSTNLFDEDFLNTEYYSGLHYDENKAQKVALGKRLFYDGVLSDDGGMSCGSCHQPEAYFTDGLPKSMGRDGVSSLQRNAPTLINAVQSEKYFYDLRESIFEKQIKHVVHSPEEFNTDYIEIIDRLNEVPEYVTEFAAAYPNQGVSPNSIANSIAHYVASLVDYSSDFDQYVRGESNTIDESVERGFNLFMGKAACGTCHFAPTFSGLVPPLFQESESEVLGVPLTLENLHIDSDLGRAANTIPLDEVPFYVHSFKTVTVRNIEHTGPYMHNGIYKTLEEVVDFYNKGGGAGLGLDVAYQTLAEDPLDLTDSEVADLVAFMQSLSGQQIN